MSDGERPRPPATQSVTLALFPETTVPAPSKARRGQSPGREPVRDSPVIAEDLKQAIAALEQVRDRLLAAAGVPL